MDRTTIARKLREALFDHIEAGRRDALQDSAIDSLFERVLASCEAPHGLATGPALYWSTGSDATDWTPSAGTGSLTITGIGDNSYTLTPAIGDVNLETMSIYGYKDGTAQWVSVHDPLFNEVVESTRS